MKTLGTSRIAGCVMMISSLAHAHEANEHVSPAHVWSAWSFEPWVVAGIVVAVGLYVIGLRRMRSAASRWQVATIALGMAALGLTLLSPIHRLGSELLSAHMTQHELLMLVAAPLLVLGKPGTPMLWAFPLRARLHLGRVMNSRPIAWGWAAISAPFAAWLIHGASVWAWHLPFLYEATLNSEFVHGAQHVTFLGTALLFWWTLLHGRGGRMSYGVGVAYVFTTAVHTSVLGALLTCTSKIWYPIYEGRTAAWGLTALQDQQLGGLVMWVPAGLVYIAMGLWLFAKWLEESEQRLNYARSADVLHPKAPNSMHALNSARPSTADGGRHA